MQLLGFRDASLASIDLYSILVAIGGAVLLLLIFNAVTRRRV